ncbi:uncharacterized protein LOC134189770 isoform X1 [Corticium candelabrum]|uniref:uncharacterized protein LOC134189770 isoform X1 n=1 Tax=Corticium candelabrum TaxID=121492 RepID=UPI002E270EF3|nr:uncharacterized protein LOC134189770 isoform X1 [Corticium candelabrum]
MLRGLYGCWTVPGTRLLRPVFNRSLSSAIDNASSKDEDDKMTFEDFIKQRRSLRMRKRLAGLPFAFAALTGSSMFHAWLNPHMFDATSPDQLTVYFGIDPLVLAGISGVICGGVGYMIGGAVMDAAWHMFNPQQSKMMKLREADFLARISRHRASSNSRYEDDFYGDSIKSLSDYRQWIRRQQRVTQGQVTNADIKAGSSFIP